MGPIEIIKMYLDALLARADELRSHDDDATATLAWIDALDFVLVIFGEMRVEDTRIRKEAQE